MKTRFKILLAAIFITLLFLPFHYAYATHDDFVVAGNETAGKARGPFFQVYALDGTFRSGKFVLTRNVFDFQMLSDVDAGSSNHERILLCANDPVSTRSLFQLYERDGTLVSAKFVLGGTGASLQQCDSLDVDGDGVEEITVFGTLPSGEWALQVWNQNGTFNRGKRVLTTNTTGAMVEAGID